MDQRDLPLLTVAELAPHLEKQDISPVEVKEKAGRPSWLLTSIYSLASVPALSITCGFATVPGGKELPIGLQIAGKPFAEATVLRVAYAYEQQTPWQRRRPPV